MRESEPRSIPEIKPNRLVSRLPRPLRSALAGVNFSLSLALAACDPGTAQAPSEMQLTFNDLSHLVGGPHDTNLSGGIRDAVDIAPEKVISCAPGEYKVLDSPPVIASASGIVKAIGNQKDRNDPMHSVMEILTPNGLTVGAMHLDQFKVSPGDQVIAGVTEIAKVSCEDVPGGHTTGMHVHLYLRGQKGEQIPIDGHTISGYTVHAGAKDYDGTMTRGSEQIRTADTRRCGPDPVSINICGGIRNDLTKNTQTVIANPKETTLPLPTISEIAPTITKPLLKPETPKPVSTPDPLIHVNNEVTVYSINHQSCITIFAKPTTTSDKVKCILDGDNVIVRAGPIISEGMLWWGITDFEVYRKDPIGWTEQYFLRRWIKGKVHPTPQPPTGPLKSFITPATPRPTLKSR